MITWMQRQKKYLIVILWVTVISFVGAGFVGWGSYSYGSKASNIAKVGDVEISVGEFQRTYSNIYGYYNQILEGKVTEAQKKELQQVAIENLINRALLLNYANELGISATDAEVSKSITANEAFFKDGKFSKDIYVATITRSGSKIAAYEEALKKEITVTKLSQLFNLEATELETETFLAPKSIKDRFKIEVIDSKGMNPKITEEMKKEYYKTYKGELYGEPTFDISYIKVTKQGVKITETLAKDHYEKNKSSYITQEGEQKSFKEAKNQVLNDLAEKITRKEALKASVAWKKGKQKPATAKSIPMNNNMFPIAVMKGIEQKATIKISKPVKVNDGYLVYKVEKRNPPKQLTYKEAAKVLEYRVKNEEVSRKVALMARDALKKIKGQTTKFLGLGDSNGIKNLDEEETAFFLNSVFSKKESKGVINIGGKAVAYEILEQKLFSDSIDSEEVAIAKGGVKKLKNDLLMQDLITDLKNRYKIETYTEL